MCLSEVPTGKENSESILTSPGMQDFGNQAVSVAAIENARHLGAFRARIGDVFQMWRI
jgi:hypothetical protein